MFKSLRFHILAFLAITVFSLSGLGLIFVSKDSTISESDQGIDLTRQVITQTEATISQMYSTLALQRGYLLSGDKNLLTEYDTNKTMLTESIAKLQEITSYNPAQESRVEELQHHYLAFIKALDDMVSRYKAEKNLGDLSDLNKVGELRHSFERVADAIQAEESKILNTYIHKLEKTKRSLYKQLGIGFVLVSLILTFINHYLLHLQGRQETVEETLKGTEERLRLAIRGTNDGIYDWDIESQNIYWSPQFKLMLGYEDEEIQASEDAFNRLLHPDDREQTLDAINKYLHRKLPDLSLSFRLQHKAGHWLWVRMRGKALFNEDGKAIRLSGTYSDINSLKEYESRLEEAKNQAEKANEAKTEFLAHMSHEIRTPLTSISGVAEILSNQTQNLSAKQTHLVNVLTLSTLNLKELINDILDFSKIESGQVELEKKPFIASNLFQEVISSMAVRAQEKGLHFSFEYDDLQDARITGDKIRLRQILMNLIGNAMKFTPAGSVNVTVRKCASDAGAEIMEITVTDTGIGIDPRHFNLVFERFRQADASVSRKYGGTGLGLAISKGLAERMGGTISLESELGKGSTFTVAVPVHIAPHENANLTPLYPGKEAVRQIKTNLSNQKNRILLVEDYEGNIAVIGYMLDSIGCNYSVARTGLEALNLWKESRPDLILMDVQMPEMDGLTATRQIRKMEEEEGLIRTPIIGMTAHAFVEDQDECVAAGMNSYLAKPLSEEELLTEIFKYLKDLKDQKEKEARKQARAS